MEGEELEEEGGSFLTESGLEGIESSDEMFEGLEVCFLVDELRLSFLYNPEPLKLIPGAENIFLTVPVHDLSGHSVKGSSLND